MKMIDGNWTASDDETGGGDITGIIAGDGLAVTGYVNFGYDTSTDRIKVSLSKTRGSIDDHNLAYIKEFNAAEVAQINENFSLTAVDVVSSGREYKYYLVTNEYNDSIFTESYLNRVPISPRFFIRLPMATWTTRSSAVTWF